MNRISDKYVLYHAVSSYQLLEVILHRLLYHKNDHSVLILPDFISRKYPQYQRLKKAHFFDEVYLFPYLKIPHESEETVKNSVRRAYERLIPHEIKAFSDVYVAGAHFYFSLYLIDQRVPFTFLEDAAGMLSRWEELYRALKINYPFHAEIALKYGLFNGDNPWIRRVICLKRAQSQDVSGEHYLDFSVEDALAKLPYLERERLIHFFVRKKIRTSAEAVLLTQHYANLGVMSAKEQEYLYRRLRETVLKNQRLIIKVHPDDTLDYQAIFPESQVIKDVFPAELLPYLLRKKPPVIYTFDSTGCENLQKHFCIKKIRRDRHA